MFQKYLGMKNLYSITYEIMIDFYDSLIMIIYNYSHLGNILFLPGQNGGKSVYAIDDLTPLGIKEKKSDIVLISHLYSTASYL